MEVVGPFLRARTTTEKKWNRHEAVFSLTGGEFGVCHYRDFRARVDQLAEISFLLGARETVAFHFIADAIYQCRQTEQNTYSSNLRDSADWEMDRPFRKNLADYQLISFEPEYALPVSIQVHRTAEEYLGHAKQGALF